MCAGYEREVEWSDVSSVLYLPASDREHRRQIVIQLRQNNKEET